MEIWTSGQEGVNVEKPDGGMSIPRGAFTM